MYRIVLDVDGVDLTDDLTLKQLETSAYELGWSADDGHVTATLFAPDGDPVACAVEAVRWIQHAIDGCQVSRVNDELSSTSDIASELGLSREAVRLWVSGKRGPGGFPRPRGRVGGGSRGAERVWAWADVARWLFRSLSIEPDYLTLDEVQVAYLNSLLKRVPPRDGDAGPDAEWRALGPLTGDPQVASLARTEKWEKSWSLALNIGHRREVNRGIVVTPVITGSSR